MKWDLFNPKPEFNYKTMSTKLDVESLENPYIQVVWEDTPENFTQERIKSVKQYFQKKYNSTNINVITKVKTTEDTQQTIMYQLTSWIRTTKENLSSQCWNPKVKNNITNK